MCLIIHLHVCLQKKFFLCCTNQSITLIDSFLIWSDLFIFIIKTWIMRDIKPNELLDPNSKTCLEHEYINVLMALCTLAGVVLPRQDGAALASLAGSVIPFPVGYLDRYSCWSSGLRPSSLRPDHCRGMVVGMTVMNFYDSHLEYHHDTAKIRCSSSQTV